jgi:hypothetical protein
MPYLSALNRLWTWNGRGAFWRTARDLTTPTLPTSDPPARTQVLAASKHEAGSAECQQLVSLTFQPVPGDKIPVFPGHPSRARHYEQPLVVPQDEQTWQEPARCIWMPQE